MFFYIYQCNGTALKIKTNFSDDVHFLHARHFNFTINANIVNIPVEATFSMSILCPSHHGQYFNSWSVAAFTVSRLISSQSLTERASDNQRLGTSNDTTSVVKRPTLKSQLD